MHDDARNTRAGSASTGVIKLTAIADTVAWGGFWAFGLVALGADPADTALVTLAAVIAAACGGAGMVCHFRCIRHAEAIGYAKRPNRVPLHLKTQETFA